MLLFALVIGIAMMRFEPVTREPEEPSNPAELSTALGFGILYSVVLFISAAVNEQLQVLIHTGELNELKEVDQLIKLIEERLVTD